VITNLRHRHRTWCPRSMAGCHRLLLKGLPTRRTAETASAPRPAARKCSSLRCHPGPRQVRQTAGNHFSAAPELDILGLISQGLLEPRGGTARLSSARPRSSPTWDANLRKLGVNDPRPARRVGWQAGESGD